MNKKGYTTESGGRQNGFAIEPEIKDLNNRHENLKIEIENNQKDYEKLIDRTADEISHFLEKANSEKLS